MALWRSRVRAPLGPSNETILEPQSQSLEEFLAMLRLEQRHKLVELPSDIMTEVVRDDFFLRFYAGKWGENLDIFKWSMGATRSD
jgi:hypothetical protein